MNDRTHISGASLHVVGSPEVTAHRYSYDGAPHGWGWVNVGPISVHGDLAVLRQVALQMIAALDEVDR